MWMKGVNMARQGFPSDKQDQFVVRLPDGMRDRIKLAADANNRSMNAEIVAAVEDKFPNDSNLLGVSYALTSLKLALHDNPLDPDELRKWVEEAEEDLEEFKKRLIKGDRGGIF